LKETLKVLNKDYPSELGVDMALDKATEFIKQFDPSLEEEESEVVLPRAAIRQQHEAAEALALDLMLSSEVFAPPGAGTSVTGVEKESSPNATSSKDKDASGLEGATAALSLKPSGPPPFHFQHLKPFRRTAEEDDDEYADPVNEEKSLLPAGVQYLMDEWKLGEDPSKYVYVDPYAAEEEDNDVESYPQFGGRQGKDRGTGNASQEQGWASQPPPMSQLPPTIAVRAKAPPTLISASQPQPSGRPKVRFSSPGPPMGGFPATQPNPGFPQSSQEAMPFPSTQNVPGRFGGKLTTGKKPVKKRMGGF